MMKRQQMIKQRRHKNQQKTPEGKLKSVLKKNCSAQSSESTGPPSSPQETELIDDSGMASQYQYSGYMYPPYHINAKRKIHDFENNVIDPVPLKEIQSKQFWWFKELVLGPVYRITKFAARTILHHKRTIAGLKEIL